MILNSGIMRKEQVSTCRDVIQMSNDTHKAIDPITLAALRPEFRSPNFNPDDYELQGGLLVRKDRFISICRNVASKFYHGGWSCETLKRHLSALSDWWGQFNSVALEDSFKPAFILYKDNEYSVDTVDPISRYAIENGYFYFKKENEAAPESKNFDLILKDGTLLAGCSLRHACVQRPGRHNESTQLAMAAEFFWRIQDHEIKILLTDILAIREKTERQMQAPPFLATFTRENLVDDNERQLEFEETQKSTQPPLPIPFKID